MKDIWGFLAVTLNVSSAALLVLLLKRLFRDKLPPRWQFAVWIIPFLVSIIPFSLFHGGILFGWQILVEMIKTFCTGQYTLSSVNWSLPLLPESVPSTLADWLYIAYLIGFMVFIIRYVGRYIQLRRLVDDGFALSDEKRALQETAEKYRLPLCRIVTVKGISSAFVFGLFKPVLVLPQDKVMDEKVFLHELLHLKYHDAWYGVLIALVRCVHWCNPFIFYCCNRAGNDLESWCDQRVMERLDGEERRTYGKILLSMADDKYANIPGTTSIANGGKNIRRRIQNIVRFKKYPKDMGIVQVCIVLVLFVSLFNLKAFQPTFAGMVQEPWRIARARVENYQSAGEALDGYAKAVMFRDGVTRAKSAPLDMQKELIEEMHIKDNRLYWDGGLTKAVDTMRGYAVMNPEVTGENEMQCWVVITITTDVDKDQYGVQKVSVSSENGRWSVVPLTDFEIKETQDSLYTVLWLLDEPPSFSEFPSVVYEAENEDVKVRVTYGYYMSFYNPYSYLNQGERMSPLIIGDGSFIDDFVWCLPVFDIACAWKNEQPAEDVNISWDKGQVIPGNYDYDMSCTLTKEEGYRRTISGEPEGIKEETIFSGMNEYAPPASFVAYLKVDGQSPVELKMERTGEFS